MEHAFDQFGKYLYNDKVMKERLPRPVYKRWETAINKEDALDRPTADAIAHSMKTWAIELGATHYTHWFQPMTGSTAEKHESFIDLGEDGFEITRFSGKALIKGEPDASSFPNGGLRATFEARGYTYWDCSSPVFIRNNVLCIPTIFVAFTGESLDKKAPLLKSIDVLSKHATRVVNIFGDKDVKQVHPMIGIEQEYFLVDKELFLKRKDLMLCGRTLLGAMPPKGQELEDHYFGSIPARVARFMRDVNQKLWELGIYAKAEHNEVAPGQFEIAPLFATCNVAVDQNYLIMDVLRTTAQDHGLVCLLHEKPFAGINGSGKHNNWSLQTDNGQNLFEPGDKPHENIRFLLFTCAVIEAVDRYPELLRMASSSAGNDHRLGASEAPPAIISIFMGHLEKLLLQLESGTMLGEEGNIQTERALTNISYLPKDNSDRNRTSPFAFTGNKFEFRMVGSSRSSATSNIILNTIVGDALERYADELETYKYRQDIRDAALRICMNVIKKHKRILFGGDGYSASWLIEAKARGLSNIPTFIESVAYFANEEAVDLFTKHGVYKENELLARCEIIYEQYAKTIRVEVLTLIEMVNKQIIPILHKELSEYAATRTLLPAPNEFIDSKIATLSAAILEIDNKKNDLKVRFDLAWSKPYYKDRGYAIIQNVTTAMKELRAAVDAIEPTISEQNWAIPNYEQLLFLLNYDQ